MSKQHSVLNIRLAPTHRSSAQSCFFRLLTAYCLLLTICLFAHAQARRVVIIKVDGLPYDEVDRFVHEHDPRTGKSRLPWIEHVFYEHGTRVENFYVRGMSLSAPSWSLL